MANRMKIIQNVIFFILIFGFSMADTSAQSIILKKFSLSQIDESVFLQWTISEGETCNGIQIERSTDSLNFRQIGDISGVCGSPDFAQPYEFLDTDPVKNKTNFYRLVLGNTGFSKVQSIDIIALNKDGVLILPNPATESATVYFKNERNSPHTLRLFSTSGSLILEKEGRSKSFLINTSVLDAGVYILTISEDGKYAAIGSKITVVH